MENTPLPRLFCFGLGYTGLAFARRMQARGWEVAGTVRDAARAAQLRAEGIAAHVFDTRSLGGNGRGNGGGSGRGLADPEAALAGTTHLLSSVPPDAEGDPVLAAHGDVLARLPQLSWIGYLSTTGVYGNRDGGWVDEASARRPATARGQRRVAAEDAWLALGARMGEAGADVRVHLFRLAGIYGPGRNALVNLARGTARRIDKPGQVFSRIHVDDIVAVLEAAATSPLGTRAFNVCDDAPAPPGEVIAHAAALLGIPPPAPVTLEEAGLSAMGRSFYEETKRVSNRAIKEDLGVRLTYPTYREGLAALAAAGEGRS